MIQWRKERRREKKRMNKRKKERKTISFLNPLDNRFYHWLLLETDKEIASSLELR